jgi:hypothetical protein
VSTSVQGTRWLTSDQCHRSRVKVAEGVVVVHDLIHHTTTSVAAGHEYVAIAPPIERAGFLPPAGEVLTGESGTNSAAFGRQVGKHVAVFGYFGSWGRPVASVLGYVHSRRARLKPAAYYPGGRYVDIVGTDFYSAFPNFRGLQALCAKYRSTPFGFNEWGMWRNDDSGFVRKLFAFVRSHRRVGLMVYNEGLTPSGPFRLERYSLRRPRKYAASCARLASLDIHRKEPRNNVARPCPWS